MIPLPPDYTRSRSPQAAHVDRIITGFYLTVRFAMQVARSLRIRSHCLAVPAGKARRTQVQLHAATRGNVGWLTDTSLLPERKMHANLLFFRCTQPEADGSLEYSLSTDTGRKPNSEERRALCSPLCRERTQWPGATVMRLADGRRVGPLRRSFDERTPTELTRHHPARMRPCSSTNRSPKMRTVPCSDSVGTVSLAVSVHTAPSNCQRGRRREE